MSRQVPEFGESRVSPVIAATLASGAFVVPLALSASSSPSPNHPGIMLWYLSLRKPLFKPADWAIPVVWVGIEGCLATAAYRLVRAEPSPARHRSLALLGWNTFMIGAWSRLFFKQRRLPISTVAALSMVATGAEFVRQARRVDPAASRAGIPFVAWVAGATVLTGALWALNRRR